MWKGRLIVYKLDLLDSLAITTFADEVASLFGRLDVLINNAAQTIYRYIHLPSLLSLPIINNIIGLCGRIKTCWRARRMLQRSSDGSQPTTSNMVCYSSPILFFVFLSSSPHSVFLFFFFFFSSFFISSHLYYSKEARREEPQHGRCCEDSKDDGFMKDSRQNNSW